MNAVTGENIIGQRQLRALIANEHKQGLDAIADVVSELGHKVIGHQLDTADIGNVVLDEKPDVALVGLHQSHDHALELISEIADESTCPVVALLDEEDPEFVAKAAELGIFASASTHDRDSLKSALAVALARFSEYDRLARAFKRRAVTERAKGILMERHSLDEQQAFELLRGHARSSNRKLFDVAEAVICVHRLLPCQG
jgi:AmiR/NasT family two-component response regulator